VHAIFSLAIPMTNLSNDCIYHYLNDIDRVNFRILTDSVNRQIGYTQLVTIVQKVDECGVRVLQDAVDNFRDNFASNIIEKYDLPVCNFDEFVVFDKVARDTLNNMECNASDEIIDAYIAKVAMQYGMPFVNYDGINDYLEKSNELLFDAANWMLVVDNRDVEKELCRLRERGMVAYKKVFDTFTNIGVDVHETFKSAAIYDGEITDDVVMKILTEHAV